jgi:hypothetical protein
MTGAKNVIIGNGVYPASIPGYSDAGGMAYTITATMSNKFFLGSSANIIAAGDFSNGIFVVGSTNTNSWSCNSGNFTSNVPNISLDVYKYARFQNGISIGRDPGTYTLDVNGQFRVSDGSGWIAMSNSNSQNSFVEIKPTPGTTATMTLQLTGNMTASSNITASNVVATNEVAATGYSTFQGSNVLALGAVVNSVAPGVPSASYATYTTTAAHGFTVGQTVAIATGLSPGGYGGITATIVGVSTNTFYIANSTTGTSSGTANVGVVYLVGTAKNGLLVGCVYDQAGGSSFYNSGNVLVRSVGTTNTNVQTNILTAVGSLSFLVYSNTPPTGSGLASNSITFSNMTGANLTVGYNFTQFPTS